MSTHSLSGDAKTSPVSTLPLTWEDATNYMIRRARQLVNELIKQKGREEPPFLAEELAPLQGIKEIEKTDLGEIDALLIRRQDGYIIKVNVKHHPNRQNFSCAHEISHTFLHELDRPLSLDDNEFRMAKPHSVSKAKEQLCNAAAAELLMPESVFKRYLAGFGVSITTVDKLAGIFRVSPSTAAIRIAEVGIEPCIAFLWKPWQKTRSKGFIAKYMCKPIYVRDPSPLLKASESDSAVKSFKTFEINNIRKRCFMESKGFGRGKNRYIISLVFPDR